MPTVVEAIRREHVEESITYQLSRWKAATAVARHKGIRRCFAWLVEEGEIPLTRRVLARLMERRHRPAYRHATQPTSGAPTQARRATTLPTEAICTHCSTVNILTDAALGIDELRRQADQDCPDEMVPS